MPKHLPALGIAYNNRYTHYLATVSNATNARLP
jgi:hypothetical protein